MPYLKRRDEITVKVSKTEPKEDSTKTSRHRQAEKYLQN
jgi:hypothetical protein